MNPLKSLIAFRSKRKGSWIKEGYGLDFACTFLAKYLVDSDIADIGTKIIALALTGDKSDKNTRNPIDQVVKYGFASGPSFDLSFMPTIPFELMQFTFFFQSNDPFFSILSPHRSVREQKSPHCSRFLESVHKGHYKVFNLYVGLESSPLFFFGEFFSLC
jgi:hypothetical protein